MNSEMLPDKENIVNRSQKILIIGNGGTGKSTLAHKLNSELGIPVVHLDKLSWNDNFERVPENIFTIELNKIMSEIKMIIEGWSYQSTMLSRLKWADVIIYLKYPLEYCLNVVLNRNKEFNNKMYPYDNFTGNRVAKNDLYIEALKRVHYDYEPVVQEWLKQSDFSQKPVCIFNSIDELNYEYNSLVKMFLNRMSKNKILVDKKCEQ